MPPTSVNPYSFANSATTCTCFWSVGRQNNDNGKKTKRNDVGDWMLTTRKPPSRLSQPAKISRFQKPSRATHLNDVLPTATRAAYGGVKRVESRTSGDMVTKC